MANDLQSLIDLVKSEHGLVLDPDDPVLVLNTIGRRLNDDLLLKLGAARAPLSDAEMANLAGTLLRQFDRQYLRARIRRLNWLVLLVGFWVLAGLFSLGWFGHAWLGVDGRPMQATSCVSVKVPSGEAYNCNFWTKLPSK